MSKIDRPSVGSRLRRVFFNITVTISFVLGFFSLFLAYTNAGKLRPLKNEGLKRTATAADKEIIQTALGTLKNQDLIFVVLESSEFGPYPDVETAARNASQALNDSGLVVSVRLLDPEDPDYTTIVTQNGINRFPAVLAVKKEGGIVQVTDDLSEKNLLHAYYRVWGKTSSCDEAKSAVY